MNRKPQRYLEFFERLFNRIAEIQQTSPEKISVALAAREMGVPETTVRSTLEGRCPGSPDYWRKWKAYLHCDLDWLICGQGPCPQTRLPDEREFWILIVEKDLETSKLLSKCCDLASRNLPLRRPQIDLAMTMSEAALLLEINQYDLIVTGTQPSWNDETLSLVSRARLRPRLAAVATNGAVPVGPLIDMVDQSVHRLSTTQVIDMVEKELALLYRPSPAEE